MDKQEVLALIEELKVLVDEFDSEHRPFSYGDINMSDRIDENSTLQEIKDIENLIEKRFIRMVRSELNSIGGNSFRSFYLSRLYMQRVLSAFDKEIEQVDKKKMEMISCHKN